MIESLESSKQSVLLAHRIVDLVSAKHATDIVLLDIRGITPIADFFVICTAESNRQLGAIIESLNESLREEGIRPYKREGTNESGWVLIDYGEVVVHVFSPQEREYYRLERVWNVAPLVLRIQ